MHHFLKISKLTDAFCPKVQYRHQCINATSWTPPIIPPYSRWLLSGPALGGPVTDGTPRGACKWHLPVHDCLRSHWTPWDPWWRLWVSSDTRRPIATNSSKQRYIAIIKEYRVPQGWRGKGRRPTREGRGRPGSRFFFEYGTLSVKVAQVCWSLVKKGKKRSIMALSGFFHEVHTV